MLVVVLENPDCFAIRLTEQISCRTSVSFRSRNPNAPRTSTTTRTRTIPNFGIWAKKRTNKNAPPLGMRSRASGGECLDATFAASANAPFALSELSATIPRHVSSVSNILRD